MTQIEYEQFKKFINENESDVFVQVLCQQENKLLKTIDIPVVFNNKKMTIGAVLETLAKENIALNNKLASLSKALEMQANVNGLLTSSLDLANTNIKYLQMELQKLIQFKEE